MYIPLFYSHVCPHRYNNQLAHMPPILQLPLLEQLNVAANHLRSVSDLSECSKISRYAAYWNRISLVPLNNPLPSLESLELQRNVLHLSKVLPQSHNLAVQFSSLTKLNLSNNALPQLQVSCNHAENVFVHFFKQMRLFGIKYCAG